MDKDFKQGCINALIVLAFFVAIFIAVFVTAIAVANKNNTRRHDCNVAAAQTPMTDLRYRMCVGEHTPAPMPGISYESR